MPTYHQEDAQESNLPKKVAYPNGLTLSRIYYGAPDSDYWEVAVIKDGKLQDLIPWNTLEDEDPSYDQVAVIPKDAYANLCSLVCAGNLADIRNYLQSFYPHYK